MQDQAINFQAPTEEAAPILLPPADTLFAERAARFATLAASNSLGDWLGFLGNLSQAQQNVLPLASTVTLPTPGQLALAREHAMPPLDPAKRPSEWRTVLRQLLAEIAVTTEPLPVNIAQALAALQSADDTRLEALAEQLPNGEPAGADAALLPFIAAALQVVYTRQASLLDTATLQKLEHHNICPCCGSPAVASIVRLGSTINNLRYLHCSLCNSEWNVSRAVCIECGSEKDVVLQELAGSGEQKPAAVRGESCDGCKSYLKIVYQEKDPLVDPVADDLATLALDVLLDEAGYQRAGPNLLLIGAHRA
ncbi:MAG: formate dehydrogenase accessory protein FdhE [Azonexus sp.]|nr:formate dehydrogenase accessory protein FdhE [Azonexus sp.]MCK6412886.1 formate dehydrogenase accessory protein FdhE [Azonexus sp.]